MSDEPTTTLKLHRFLTARDNDSCETVTGLVVRAAHDAAANTPVVRPKGTNLPEETMLSMVTYCYAKGVCGSGDIERRLWTNPEVRRAVGGEIPDAKAMRRFRRLNRATLQAALECALKSIRRAVARHTAGQPLITGDSVAPQPSRGGATSNLAPGEETTTMVRREAAARLDTAAMLDSTLDD